MVTRPRPALLAVALTTALFPAVVSGQTRAPGWMGNGHGAYEPWSLFWPPADLPRLFPSASSSFRGLLEGSESRVGLFWNGSNPGALPFEMDEAGSEFTAGMEDVSGEYHRPFDAGEESRTQVRGAGWQPLGARGAGMASATLENTTYSDGVFSDGVHPYGSSPYVVADTTGTDLTQLAARLEAAAGWRLGPYGLGVAAGFQGQETRTEASPVPRKGHSAGPGVSGGVVRGFSDGNLRLGIFSRWQSLNETLRAYTVAAPTRIYQINGYDEPPPQDLTGIYERRLEQEAWTLGAGASGESDQTEWALWGHRARVVEQQTNERMNDPRSDEWRAWSTTLGGSLQRRVFGTAHAAAELRWTALKGEAEPAPSVDAGDESLEDPVAFRIEEELLDFGLDFRTPMGGGRWMIAATLTLSQEWRHRMDTRVRAGSNLNMRTLGASIEVLRTVSRGLSISAGGALLGYDPVGSIPDPAAMGPEYRRWIGPELALLGTPATTQRLTIGARWDPGTGRAFWLRLGTSSFGVGNLSTVLPLLPEGKRSSWSLLGGVNLRD